MMGMTALAPSPDIAAIGYPAVREAFNEVLNACSEKLTKAEFEWALEILELETALDENEIEYLADTVLYSLGRNQWLKPKGKRPIDRIAPKLLFRGDALKTYLARRLPEAFFSIHEVEGSHPDGGAVIKDLMDKGRRLHVMDMGLAASVSAGTLLAGRFVDLGPWHVGFGIILPLRKSEAAAILLVSSAEEVRQARNSLHELVYAARLHDQNLVSMAIEPMVLAFSLGIDNSDEPVSVLVESLRSALPIDGPA